MEPRTALAGRLAPTIKGLIQAFGNVAVQRPALAPILRLLYLRLFALVGRIDRLATKFRDGTLPKPRLRDSCGIIQTNKVFLLLFVHKKKNPSFPLSPS